jgi:hypothetical protein
MRNHASAPHAPLALLLPALLVLVTACGDGRAADIALTDEVPHSSRDQYELQLDALEDRLQRADDDAPPAEAARVAALVGRREELARRMDLLDKGQTPEQERDRDAFEQDLLQLEADVAGIEQARQAATVPAGFPAESGPG